MAVSTLHSRARSAKSTTRKALPVWADEAGRFLGSLGLDDLQRAEICRHLDRTRSAERCPVLRANDAEVLGAIIARNGKPAPTLRQAIASVVVVEMPSASTGETPRPDGAPDVSDSAWDECRAIFDRTPIVAPTPKPDERPVKPRPIAALARSSTDRPSWMLSEETAERIAATSLCSTPAWG